MTHPFHFTVRPALLLAATIALASMATAQTPNSEIEALREQIRQLDQKLRVLERKQELKDEEAAAAAKAAGRVAINDKGVTLASGEGATTLRLRGLVQADSRWFFDSGLNNNDAFLIRRARLIFEGAFNRIFQYQIVPEFGGTSGNGTLTLLDANLVVALKPALQIRAGRFREPVGLEQLQSDSVAFFAERSVVSQLMPGRDIGVQVGGELFGGTMTYAFGVFNGAADGTNNPSNTDNNNKKDLAARVAVEPFKNNAESFLRGIGFSLGGSLGRQNGAAGGLTTGYRTDAQQTFFSYRASTVAKGRTYRLSPQAYFYHGPLGVQAELVISSVGVVNGALARSLQHRAWQASAGYVITGEDASYNGVVPKQPLDLAGGTWGAFEIVARVSNADLDDASFTGGPSSPADPVKSATESSTVGVGLNWYLSKSVRASFDYFHTEFDFAPGVTPASDTVIGNDENALLTRLQLVF